MSRVGQTVKVSGSGGSLGARVAMASAHAMTLAATPVPFDTTVFDDAGFVGSLPRFTVPTGLGGKYRITSQLMLQPAELGITEYEAVMYHQVGGAGTPRECAQTIAHIDTAWMYFVASFLLDSGVYELAEGDVVWVVFDGDTGGLGGNFVLGAAPYKNFMTIQKVG
jgi:hypothetical protein